MSQTTRGKPMSVSPGRTLSPSPGRALSPSPSRTPSNAASKEPSVGKEVHEVSIVGSNSSSRRVLPSERKRAQQKNKLLLLNYIKKLKFTYVHIRNQEQKIN